MVVRTKDIRVYSHNVAKNYMYLDVLLETLYNDFAAMYSNIMYDIRQIARNNDTSTVAVA